MMRILLGEDDDQIAEAVTSTLERAGFGVQRESDGETVWARGNSEAFEAIVLDLGLPRMDGLTILRRWRSSGRLAPVLILTARSHWEERVEGIEAGADDYLIKPFHILEFLARVRALVRRASGMASPRITFGDYQLDMRAMHITRNSVPVELTPQELKLVAYLLHNRNRVISQLEITEHIYQQDHPHESNAVEVLVARVRKRLGHNVIKTRRGFGYMIGDDY